MIDLRAAIGNPGTGETNIRALLASLIGPFRVAHGTHQSYRLQRGTPVLVGGNKSNAGQAAYCAFALRQGQGGVNAAVLFNSSSSMGAATTVPTVLAEAMGPTVFFAFSAILLPNDQIYAQLVDAALAQIDLVVSTVYV